METKVPFTKDIEFKTKIAEVTSISLEHNWDIHQQQINGEFIVSGEYKTHEVCINKENFEFKIPFEVQLTDDIDLNTLNLEIFNFKYDIIDDEILRVNIEILVNAQELPNVEEIVENEDREAIDVDELFIKPEEEITNIPLEANINPVDQTNQDELIENATILEQENEETILNSTIVNENKNEYTTYDIHIVRQVETLESICKQYNTTIEILKEYNDIDEINIGDKIIIPKEIDE